MAVFIWTPTQTPYPGIEARDEISTAMYEPHVKCGLCGERIARGQRVMAWTDAENVLFHSDCIKRHARGLLKDIAECTR